MGANEQPSMKDSLNTSLEVIAEEPVLRALLNAIPAVGGSLNELVAGKGQRIIEERRDNLLRQLSKHLESIEDEAIRKDYFETLEGFDLLIKALEASRKTRSEEKRDLIARILRGAILDYERDNYAPEEYLNLISDLTVQELRVARSIYEDRPNYKDSDTWNAWETRVCAEVGIGQEDLHMALDRIASLGLLRQVIVFESEPDQGYYTAHISTSAEEGNVYMVTSVFEKMMRFLELDL